MQQGTWNRNREHQGIQVSFPSKPELEVIHDLKNAGFKWSGRQKIWYAKEYPYRVELLNILATYGGEVGEEKSFAEIMEAKVERSKDRAERHREYADNAAKKAEGCMNSAHQIQDIIPPGQPILVGHHSEGRHRRDLARVDRYSKRPGRRTKRLHIMSSGPEHQHPSNGGPLTWLRLSDASRGLRRILGDITGSWINKN
jgi:hypothetical protein